MNEDSNADKSHLVIEISIDEENSSVVCGNAITLVKGIPLNEDRHVDASPKHFRDSFCEISSF